MGFLHTLLKLVLFGFLCKALAQNSSTSTSSSSSGIAATTTTTSPGFLESTVVSSSPSTSTENTEAEVSVLEKWKGYEKALKKITGGIVKNVIAAAIRGPGRPLNVSAACMGQVMKVLAGIKNIRPWAFSFFDASGKIIDGMLMGTMASLGEYDQCIATEAIEERRGKNQGKVIFTGHYCALDIRPPLPPKKPWYKMYQVLDEFKNFSQGNTVVSEGAKFAHLFYLMAMRIGICVPSGCSASDISQVTERFAERSNLSIEVRRCEGKPEKVYTKGILAIIVAYSFFGLLMLIGTILDVYSHYTKHVFRKVWIQLLLAFSFMSSFKKLVNTENEPGPFACFSGLRVLSITWIVLAHTYLNLNLQLFRSLKFAMDFPKDFAFQAVVNATVAVDTFFFMGGALVCYLTVKIIRETKRPFNIGLYIFHRIFRIMPIYSMAIAFMFLAPLLGYGPVWHDTVDGFVESCHKNWWTNLLFINNFYDAEHMCLPQSWYIACDVQLYIAALVVLLPLLRSPKVGLTIAVLGVLASMIGTGALTYAMGYPPTLLTVYPDHDERMTHWATSYFKPYSHAGPYCVGLLLGYLLVTKPKMKLSLNVRIVGWCMAIATNMAVLYGVWEWNKGVDATTAESIFYSSCHRVAWSIGVSWVVLNCANGQGGVVNYILTWKAWTVLARLTYGAYLIHPMVQIAAVGNVRMKLQPWHYFGVWMFFGHLFITYGCSFAATMLVEAPFLTIEKIMFRKQIDEVKKDMNKNGNPANLPQIENGSAKMDPEAHYPQLRKRSTDDKEFVCRL